MENKWKKREKKIKRFPSIRHVVVDYRLGEAGRKIREKKEKEREKRRKRGIKEKRSKSKGISE